MATTCKLIAKNVLGSNTASVTLGSIPATYTDLMLVASVRQTRTGLVGFNAFIRFNGDSGNNYSQRYIYSDGSTVSSGSNTAITYANALRTTAANATANTFASCEVYIPNYAGSAYKSLSATSTTENNATNAEILASAWLWSATAAITSMYLQPQSGDNFVAGSSFYLYGITKA